MGTIAELLGGRDLSPFEEKSIGTTSITLASPQNPNTPPTASDTPTTHEVVTTSNPTQTLVTPEEILISALLEETGLEPSQTRAELQLRADLDMDDLSLYAVVTVIERSLKRNFTDEDIRAWETIGDMLNAVTTNR